jgi:hypothetical protein
MHSIVEEETKQLNIIHQQVRLQQAAASIEMNAITYITNEIARFVQIYSDLFNFELAVESLAHRILSASLIGPRKTKSLFENITRSFEGTSKRLCFTAPHQFMHQRNQGRRSVSNIRGAQSLPCPPVSPSLEASFLLSLPPFSSFPLSPLLLPSLPFLFPPSPLGVRGRIPLKIFSGSHARTRVLVHFLRKSQQFI